MSEQQHIESLLRRVAELEARLEPSSATGPTTAAAACAPVAEPPDDAPRSSRRNMLKLAGAAVVGAAASGVGAQRAAATNGEPVTLGAWKTATSSTRTDLDNNFPGAPAFLFQAGTNRDGNGLGTTAALAGVTSAIGVQSGVLGWTFQPSGSGVHGQNDSTLSDHAGVTGVGNSLTGSGVHAVNPPGTGLKAEGAIAVAGLGSKYGLFVGGDRAAIVFASTQFSPPARVDAHNAGELDLDIVGDLWFCVTGGTPGTWRKVSGATTAGQLHAITPARVYDSRRPAPAHPLSTGQNRLINVANSIDVNGNVAVSNVVPMGATAIAYNLTVVNTVGTNGYLTVNPGGITTAGTSAINWTASYQTIANASLVSLSSARQVTVICSGTATSANFIIDVVGYYR